MEFVPLSPNLAKTIKPKTATMKCCVDGTKIHTFFRLTIIKYKINVKF